MNHTSRAMFYVRAYRPIFGTGALLSGVPKYSPWLSQLGVRAFHTQTARTYSNSISTIPKWPSFSFNSPKLFDGGQPKAINKIVRPFHSCLSTLDQSDEQTAYKGRAGKLHVSGRSNREKKRIPLDNNDNLTNEPATEVLSRTRELVPTKWSAKPGVYMELTKMRLSALVVLTTMVGYAIAPGAINAETLFYTTLGTGLCVSAANSINQWAEVPFDGQMSRTGNRAIVRQELSPLHALTFGVACGAAGTGILCTEVNSLVALLGFTNILLYTCVYTPSKRFSITNTWTGAVVGAIPPMMGWAACTGGLEDGAWVLAGILYAWQFPHFNSLSWNLRQDYSKAGYHMMSVTNPGLCMRVALRYSALLFPLCYACCYVEMTTINFAYTSTLVNGAMFWESWKFYRNGNSKSARGLFFASIIHLPVLLSLLLLHKKTKEVPTMVSDTERDYALDSQVVYPVQIA
ncbi:hypothetical protein SARC_03889 [Sphaeroforma arctica JP610]|uniref:Protoheme IX farnesyltransferase, mitochondrial n=1 Tax=Sphaeroforma arctica JP610 TaxID=667725 RepID=A0A0L0G4N5_9EUKA|nr:hypothetical protein SARC_03889 [Sphaeroforma arctica JP610]KNC83864.1 hypothetical protein SARC_03889 [Sphaeroforma arctica JP610]|eukprot:XP_014157766.1 hypothetical protein SARC_03889 [Sphaeroforma arctica JP610]